MPEGVLLNFEDNAGLTPERFHFPRLKEGRFRSFTRAVVCSGHFVLIGAVLNQYETFQSVKSQSETKNKSSDVTRWDMMVFPESFPTPFQVFWCMGSLRRAELSSVFVVLFHFTVRPHVPVAIGTTVMCELNCVGGCTELHVSVLDGPLPPPYSGCIIPSLQLLKQWPECQFILMAPICG